jgi:hypothetical protein
MQPMYYIGLDVHKRKISYCVKESSGRIHAEGSISSTRLELDHWMRSLPQPWSAAMEATMFTGWIYDNRPPVMPSATKLLLVSAQMVERWEQRKDRGDDRLDGPGYLFSFAIVERVGRPSTIPRRWVRKVRKRYTCQIGARAICWKKEAKRELFHFEPRPQGILRS